MTGILNLLAGAVGVVKDTYFNLVTLLLPGNGTNGAQNNTFLDSSTNNFTITRNGNTTQGTFSPFSQTGWSNFFDGNGDNLTTSTNVSIGTQAFTYEFFVYFTASPQGYLLGQNASGGAALFYESGVLGLARAFTGNDLTYTTTFAQNTWHHIVVVRSGTGTNQTAFFINGTRVATGTVSSNYSTSSFYVGGVSGASFVTGYISNARIVVGTAVYDPTQSSLTVPTSPLTAVTNTSFLTCQSNRFIDNSTNAFTITRNGDVSVQAFSPFAPTAAYSASTVGGSAYFDGTGDYLSVADNAAFDLGSGDFLIEAWAYSTNSTNFKMVIGHWNSGGQGAYTLRQNAGKWAFTYTTNGTTEVALNGTSTQQLNAWAHLAVIRTGTTLSLFVNGTREATASVSGVTIFNSNGNFSVGGNGSVGDLWLGYVGPCRVIKTTLPSGYDATQTTLTVPTAPFTSTASTSILCNFTNAGITDATAKNDLETVGNAQISTSQNKFGGSSMLFDGNDALVIPYKELLDLKTTFTIEAWIYPTNVTAGYRGIYTINAASGSNYGTLALYHDGTTLGFELRPTSGGGITAITGGTLSANTWHHVAFSMSSLSGRLFLNGTQVGSTTTFTDYSFTVVGVAAGNIGNNPTSTQGFVGYIDDLRITRGYARYTSNFTAPTAAFALQ